MSDPRDFLLNTDYEMDKIVYFKSGEFTGSTSFAHNLAFAPLIFGVWSTDEDFSSSNTLGVQPYGAYDPDTLPLCVGAMVIGNQGDPGSDTQIEMTSYGKDSETTKIYYRIYAFAPPEFTGSTPKTSKDAKQFMLNTDYNYRKLKASGEFTHNGEEYTHGLGYYPHIMAWELNETSSQYWIMPLVRFGSAVELEVYTDKIKLVDNSATLTKLYWRVYHDET